MAEIKRIGKRGGGKDISGQRFSRWTVLFLHGQTAIGALAWMCRCDCGVERVVSGNSLRNGKSKSCGCFNREMSNAKNTSHGRCHTPEYHAWAAMKSRCTNLDSECYSDYGGRGISVCERWQSFARFFADMGPRPSTRHSLDRIDNNGNYEPGNCRWAIPVQQAQNRRTNKILTHNGQALPIAAWARLLGMAVTTLRKRLDSGWSIESALTKDVDKTFSTRQRKITV